MARRPIGKLPRKSGANKPLTVEVVTDQLVISIGVKTLAFAIENGPEWSNDDRIVNPAGFAEDIARELANDTSGVCGDGDTDLQRAIDKAAERAVESDSKHVKLAGES